jgi:hypothetical protein
LLRGSFADLYVAKAMGGSNCLFRFALFFCHKPYKLFLKKKLVYYLLLYFPVYGMLQHLRLGVLPVWRQCCDRKMDLQTKCQGSWFLGPVQNLLDPPDVHTTPRSGLRSDVQPSGEVYYRLHRFDSGSLSRLAHSPPGCQ